MATSTRAVTTRTLTALLERAALVAVAWWALTEGDGSMLVYAAVVVPLVAVLSLAVTGTPEPHRPGLARRVLAGLGLAGWVLRQALVGGVDVARRALGRRVDVDPFWTTYRTTLPSGTPRVLMVLVMNLLPGSLSASLDDDHVDVHVISPDLDVEATLAELERRLGVVLGR